MVRINIKKFIKIIFFSFSIFFIIGGILISIILFFLSGDQPKVQLLEEYKPSLITRIYDVNGEVIGELFEEKRILVPLRKIPKYLVEGIIATEDSRYYEHSGIDLKGILRAIFKDVIHLGVVEGGSSITQQLAKNLLLTREKTITRKIKEIIFSLQIEKKFSKEEILEMYLNNIYFGSGAYGVEAAARVYFGKHIEDLNLEECSLLAGLPRAPYYYSPYVNIERSLKRRNWVLHRMFKMKKVTKEQMDSAIAEPIKLGRLETRINNAPYFNEYIRQLLTKNFGDKTIYQEGLNVYTTLDINLQKKAEEVMKKALEKANEKVGAYKSVKFLKPIEQLQKKKSLQSREDILKVLNDGDIVWGKTVKVTAKKAEVDFGYGLTGELDLDSMPWAKRSISISNFSQGNASSEAVRVSIRKVSDIIKKDDLVRVTKRKSKKNPLALNLIQEQLVQGALLCIDAQTGYIKAMVGGYDFRMTPFNRAYQAWRQPGSAFKPFIYTAAIDNKIITPSSIIFDAPVSYVQFRTWKKKKLVNVLWTPANYHKTYNGDVTARYALAYSLNIPAIKVLERTGADKVISYAHKAGLTSINNKNLSLALGTSEVTLLSLTSAFSIFANQGIKVTPIAIRYIEGNNGSVLAQYTPVETPVLNENTAYIMASMMESVVKFGTAKKVKALNRPVAGKTGTTDRAVDAWFIGFTPEIITGMYVGLDDRTSMGQHASGEELVVPYWTEFMLEAVKDMPYSSFTAPDGLTFADVDPQTGLIAASACNTVNPEVFLKGTEPKTLCRHKERNLLDNKTKFTLSSFKKNTEEKENN